MKIIGINTAVTTVEDISPRGTTLPEPTAARIHALVSGSAEDDSDGILQQETATVSGTITNPGDIALVVTSAGMTGSPVTLAIPVVNGNAESVATAIRAFLNADASAVNIRAKFDISGATDKVILTAKVAAANDGTLNMALATGTATGLDTAASSANTRAGVAGTGAKTVKVSGINGSGLNVTETVALQGVTPVNTVNAYLFINELVVLTTGSGGANAGLITATAATDSTITSQIEIGDNISKQAFYMSDKRSQVKNLYLSAINATGGAITRFTLSKKALGGPWVPYKMVELLSGYQYNDTELITLKDNEKFKVTATVSAGSSSVVCTFDGVN